MLCNERKNIHNFFHSDLKCYFSNCFSSFRRLQLITQNTKLWQCGRKIFRSRTESPLALVQHIENSKVPVVWHKQDMSKFGNASLFRSTFRTFKRSARLVYRPVGVVHPLGEKWAFPSRNDALGPANQSERALLFEVKMYVNKPEGFTLSTFCSRDAKLEYVRILFC